MKKILLFLFLLAFIPTLLLAKENNDAVYLKQVKEYTLNSDGSVLYHQSQQLKLLTYFAFNRRYGETFVVFDTLYQKLTVHRNNTTMANGTKIAAPANAFNLVLPRAARNSAAYNHLREMVITHTALERNAVIDLDYTLQTKKDFLPGLSGDVALAEDSPIRELLLRVRIPANKDLKFHLFNSAVTPEIKTEDGQKTYQWKFINVPAQIHETQQPPAADFLPRLQFSTLTNLSEAFKPLNAALQNVSVPAAFKPFEGSPLEQALSIQEKIVHALATFPIAPATVGFRFRSPDEVWKSGGGTPLEKAVLFASLLQKSGIDGKAVLIANPNRLDETIPCLTPFARAAVCIHLSEGNAFMASVNQLNPYDLRYTYGGRKVLVFTGKGLRQVTLPSPPEDRNAASLKARLTINDDGKIDGTFDLNLSGAANPYLEIQRNDGNVEKNLQAVFPGSNMTRLSMLDAGQMQAGGSFKKLDNVKKQADFLFYELPQNPFGIAALHLAAPAANRTTPLQLPFANYRETAHFSIQIPKGWEFIVKKTTTNMKNTAGEIQIRFVPEDGKLQVKRSFSLKRSTIPVTEFNDFMELWRLWNAPVLRQVVFKKN